MNKNYTLKELNAKFYGSGGEGIFQKDAEGNLVPAPKRTGIGVAFDCPCGAGLDDPEARVTGSDAWWYRRCYIPFSNPIDGGPPDEKGWQRTGDTIDTLTLSPSIQRHPSDSHQCSWHGWVRDGKTVSC